MNLTAVFEHWHLGDGNYPALAVGDEARLSFELDIQSIELVPPETPDAVAQVRDAEYRITGRVIRRYDDGVGTTFAVLEAGWLRFYCPSARAATLPVGSCVRLLGTLALDHYLWVEFLDRYPDPPNLFYNLRVARIRRVVIPERFVRRGPKSVSYPTCLPPERYGPDGYENVPVVEESEHGPAFSLIDFELLPVGSGPERPTFVAP